MKSKRSVAASAPPSTFERVVKWVAGIGAIVSLLLGLFEVSKLIHEADDRVARVHELARVARAQSDSGEYAAAWVGLEQALSLTDAAGPLETWLRAVKQRRHTLREQQEDVAMQWLRDARPGPGHPFSDIVDRVAPALERGAADANGQRRADLLAHLGWGRFLRGRDGTNRADPARDYANALVADAKNVYAHAFWGHWIAWQHGDLAAALQHFAQALADSRAASGPVRAYVRHLQVAALRNGHSTQTDAALVALVNTMRANAEPIDAGTRDSLKSIYYDFGRDAQRAAALLQAAPVAEQAATLRQLAFDEPYMRAVLAKMLEAAGR